MRSVQETGIQGFPNPVIIKPLSGGSYCECSAAYWNYRAPRLHGSNLLAMEADPLADPGSEQLSFVNGVGY